VAQANVLVTGVGSIIGQGIIKSLKLSNIEHSSPVTYKIFAADMSPQAAGLYRCDKAFLIPSATSDDYYDQVSRICKENDVEAVFVGTDEEATYLAALKDRLKKEAGTVLINSPEEVIRIAADKWSTFQYLKKNKIPCALSALPEDKDGFIGEVGFPFVVKPREGHGSLHFYVVHNDNELMHAISAIESVGWKPILQEYLGGTNNEFTSGVTIDKIR
jgi:carbamoyl-phosphate synthase large subunit